ncbi:uncharacterized protein MELLADRAFT_93496 [Melampsora larici-populina 98AG31]|uniref:Glucose-methanol-choline oxidoreductase N-terminal domain-containing protein n=1 Tax=Melampsora larici-populina (strain 98AG31 / pathotype 3-4-7) TaxID=747676 RepID=F4RAL7_MELLP|nr:uncharacterized protein MELLADRAFT_93496 [Melampsora larici-populina 98AG31]EGG10759.1 hypothetical protein MELLADRAFT_93496 [Melampsora larici-populina 98AG31]
MSIFDREVDIIICGGGSAGSVIAGRLARADPSLEILVIEAGMNNLDHPKVIKPAMYLSHIAPNSDTAFFHLGRKSEHLNGRAPIVPTGKILGGGSSINFMMYTRASGSDYDDWKQPGWSAEDLVPLMKKTETFHTEIGDPGLVHGFEGPLHISRKQTGKLGEEFFKVLHEYGGIPQHLDLQDFKSGHGVQRWDKWINPITGRRSDAAHGFIHPAMRENSNLQLLVHTRVKKVLFEDNVAEGVECLTEIPGDPTGPYSQSIKARKMVVISAGAISSPQILQRSGIGSKGFLEKLGVQKVISDLPGVGQNYQDHQLLLIPYKASDDTESLDELLRAEPSTLVRWEDDFTRGEGGMTSNWVDVSAKVRPNVEELKGLGPDFQQAWKDMFADAPDKPVAVTGIVGCYTGDPLEVPKGKYFTVFSYSAYPLSMGYVNITSLEDLDSPPDFDPKFLSSPADLSPHVWMYKRGREWCRRLPSFRGEVEVGHPKFATNSAAYCNIGSDQNKNYDENSSKSEEIQDIIYSEEDDKVIEDHIRNTLQTTWHSLGTLAMKPREKGGVVDSCLNVYGTRHLKVADLSICPGNVGANTNSTALMIGEKAAVLILEDLGLVAL